MHEAALKDDADPDTLSFIHTARVVRRKLALSVSFPPQERAMLHESVLDEILEDRVVSSQGRRNHRGVKRKMSKYPIRSRNKPMQCIENIENYIRIIK